MKSSSRSQPTLTLQTKATQTYHDGERKRRPLSASGLRGEPLGLKARTRTASRRPAAHAHR
jgi:hypothetical protein